MIKCVLGHRLIHGTLYNRISAAMLEIKESILTQGVELYKSHKGSGKTMRTERSEDTPVFPKLRRLDMRTQAAIKDLQTYPSAKFMSNSAFLNTSSNKSSLSERAAASKRSSSTRHERHMYRIRYTYCWWLPPAPP